MMLNEPERLALPPEMCIGSAWKFVLLRAHENRQVSGFRFVLLNRICSCRSALFSLKWPSTSGNSPVHRTWVPSVPLFRYAKPFLKHKLIADLSPVTVISRHRIRLPRIRLPQGCQLLYRPWKRSLCFCHSRQQECCCQPAQMVLP